MIKVKVACVFPPIPIRDYDYQAYVDGDEEGKTGCGATYDAAVKDLADHLDTAVEDLEPSTIGLRPKAKPMLVGTGGPASAINDGFHEPVIGMTLLDHFAGQALSGILSHPESMQTVRDIAEEKGIHTVDATAQFCYLHADAMIAEKRRKEAMT